jgi:hypothetical protein
VVVAILSMVISLGIVYSRFNKHKWVLALTVPFVIANVLYWSPVMLGADSLEYGSWAPLFVIPWYLAGALSSALIVFVFNRRLRSGTERRG